MPILISFAAVDCEMSEWGDWTPCAKTCGQDSIQERSRKILSHSRRGGRECGNRIERRYCELPPCPSSIRQVSASSFRSMEQSSMVFSIPYYMLAKGQEVISLDRCSYIVLPIEYHSTVLKAIDELKLKRKSAS
jgi:hypothetical protein